MPRDKTNKTKQTIYDGGGELRARLLPLKVPREGVCVCQEEEEEATPPLPRALTFITGSLARKRHKKM